MFFDKDETALVICDNKQKKTKTLGTKIEVESLCVKHVLSVNYMML